VDVFTYLGSLFTRDGQSSKDIKVKLGKAKALMTGLKTLWQSHSTAILTKVRLLRSLVWPVISHGCESWTLKNSDESRMKSFEMKSPRQLLCVSWTDRTTNDWVLQKAETEPNLLQAIKKRKLSFYGHVLRKEGSYMEKETIYTVQHEVKGEEEDRRCIGMITL